MVFSQLLMKLSQPSSHMFLYFSLLVYFSHNNFVSEAILIFKSAFISRFIFTVRFSAFISSLICGFYLLVRPIMITFFYMVLRPSTNFITKNSCLYFTVGTQCNNVNYVLKKKSRTVLSPLLQRLTDNCFYTGKHKSKQKLDSQ